MRLACSQALQSQSNVVFRKRLVAVGRQQTAGCREDGALTVALNGSAFEHEVVVWYQFSQKGPLPGKVTRDGIVLLPFELLAPSIETEVEQPTGMILTAEQRQRCMVACPCVVDGSGVKMDARPSCCIQCRSQAAGNSVGIAGGYDEWLEAGDGLREPQ